MAKKTKQRPVETLRDGAIKAAIWKNESEKGAFFTVTFSRTFRNGGGDYQDTSSYSGSQLLRLARLADTAYNRCGELTKAARAAAEEEGV